MGSIEGFKLCVKPPVKGLSLHLYGRDYISSSGFRCDGSCHLQDVVHVSVWCKNSLAPRLLHQLLAQPEHYIALHELCM
jgi:hypothetical protein